MKEKIRQFMIGRYGTDGLNQFLNIASLVLILVYILTRLPLLLYVGVVLLGLCYYRMFSRNISKRTEENYKYYAVKDRIRNKFSGLKDQWNNRKLYHYYRCPQCRQKLRFPGAGAASRSPAPAAAPSSSRRAKPCLDMSSRIRPHWTTRPRPATARPTAAFAAASVRSTGCGAV